MGGVSRIGARIHAGQHRRVAPGRDRASRTRTFGVLVDEPWWPHPEDRSWGWARFAARFGLGLLPAAYVGAMILVRRRRIGTLLLLVAPIVLACLTSIPVYGNPPPGIPAQRRVRDRLPPPPSSLRLRRIRARSAIRR